MHITVQFLGQARQLSHCDQAMVEAEEGSSIDDLIPILLADASAPLCRLLSDGPRLRRSVMAILHDETVDPSQGELLKDGDELSLLPPMSGG